MKIKIVYIITSLGTGGAETLLKDYCKYIDKKIFQVTVIVLGKKRNTNIEYDIEHYGINILYLDKKVNSFFDKVFNKIFRKKRLFHCIRTINPSVIHTHLAVNQYLYKCNRLLNGKKIYHTVHAPANVSFEGSAHKRKEKKFTKLLIKRYNMYLIAVQNSMKIELSNMFNTNNLIVVNNAIDINRFISTNISKEDFRKKNNIPLDKKILCHIGRFTYAKNHEFIIEIFGDLVKKSNNYFLVLVGDGELKMKILESLSSPIFKNKFLIMSNRNDIQDILHACDIFIFPSIYESFGLAVLEAQVTGIPCIISDTIPKDVIISENIYPLSVNNKEDWIDAIEKNYNRISIDKSIYKEMDIVEVVKKIEKIYEGTL